MSLDNLIAREIRQKDEQIATLTAQVDALTKERDAFKSANMENLDAGRTKIAKLDAEVTRLREEGG